MRYNRSLIFFLLTVAILTFLSCSGKPSEKQVKEDVINNLNKRWPNLLEVKSFQKTNGEGDSKSYTIYYTVTAEIKRDGNAFGSGIHLFALRNFKWINIPQGQQRSRLKYGITKTYPRMVKKGGVFHYSASRTYRKTEKGWI